MSKQGDIFGVDVCNDGVSTCNPYSETIDLSEGLSNSRIIVEDTILHNI